MCRTAGSVALVGLVVVACGTPGYAVSVRAAGLPRFDDALLTRLETEAKESGFAPSFTRRENDAFPDELVSWYSKVLSAKPHDTLSIGIFCEGIRNPPSSIEILVENRLRGMEEPVKHQIDALGDRFEAELSSAVGKEKVTVKRGPASIPIFY
jgi:hypothetical protein